MIRKVLLVFLAFFTNFCVGSDFADTELEGFENKILATFGKDSYDYFLENGKFFDQNDLLTLFKLIKTNPGTKWVTLLDGYEKDSKNMILLDLYENSSTCVTDQVSYLENSWLQKSPISLIETLPAINTNLLRLLTLLRFDKIVINNAYRSVELLDTDSLHLISLLHISRTMRYEEYYPMLLEFLFNAIDSAISSESPQKIVDSFIRACPDWTRCLKPKNYTIIFPDLTSGVSGPRVEVERLKYFTEEIEEEIIYISEVICPEPRQLNTLSACSSSSKASSPILIPPPLNTASSFLNLSLSSSSTDSYSPNVFASSKFTDLKRGVCNFQEFTTLIKSSKVNDIIRILKEYFSKRGQFNFVSQHYGDESLSNILTFLISIEAHDSVLSYVVDHINSTASIPEQASTFGIVCFYCAKVKKTDLLIKFKAKISQEVANHVEFTNFLQIINRLDSHHDFFFN